MAVDLEEVAEAARPYLAAAAAGPGLTVVQAALIAYGVAACATSLDVAGMEEQGARALAAGADEELLVEVLVLVSAVGLHALHEGVILLQHDVEPGEGGNGGPSYWARFDAELPGFTAGLERIAPWARRAFLAFAGAAVEHGRLDRLTRELLWAGIDATPTHRYVPGLRLHLGNAVRLGGSAAQLEEALAIARAGPPHRGVAAHGAALPP